MATNPQPAHQADDLTRQLKANLRRRRPRFWRITAFICLPLIIVGAFILWLAYPRTSPPRLLVIGFDALITADETPRVRARLEPQEEEPAPTSGAEVWFFDTALGPGERRQVKSAADAHGEATAEWAMPAEANQATFLVRPIADKYRASP